MHATFTHLFIQETCFFFVSFGQFAPLSVVGPSLIFTFSGTHNASNMKLNLLKYMVLKSNLFYKVLKVYLAWLFHKVMHPDYKERVNSLNCYSRRRNCDQHWTRFACLNDEIGESSQRTAPREVGSDRRTRILSIEYDQIFHVWNENTALSVWNKLKSYHDKATLSNRCRCKWFVLWK